MEKVHVKAIASVFKFATLIQSDSCIEKHKEYNVKCKILRRKLGILKTTYNLRIEGSKEDVNFFLDFLHMEGFKIEK